MQKLTTRSESRSLDYLKKEQQGIVDCVLKWVELCWQRRVSIADKLGRRNKKVDNLEGRYLKPPDQG